MFLAHFENSGLEYWEEQPIEKCFKYYNEAVKLHNKMHSEKK